MQCIMTFCFNIDEILLNIYNIVFVKVTSFVHCIFIIWTILLLCIIFSVTVFIFTFISFQFIQVVFKSKVLVFFSLEKMHLRPSQGLCSSQIWENIPIYPSGQQPFSAVKLGYESILASKKIHTFNQCFSPKFIHLNCICIFTGTENLLEGSSFRLCFGPHAALMAKVLSVRVLSPIGLI